MGDRDSREIDSRLQQMYREALTRLYGNVDMSAIELFRALGEAFHTVASFLDRKNTAQYNLSWAKLRILLWLQLHYKESINGGGMLPSELSRLQGVTPNTMSSLLTGLRESGLIEQINHPQDRRKRIVRITQAGLDTIKNLGPAHYRCMNWLFEDLSEEERQILITLLHKVTASTRARLAQDEYPPTITEE